MKRVVVGVDGSEHARRALRKAVQEGILRDAVVEAVYVYEPTRRSFADELISLPLGATAGVSRGRVSADEAAHQPPRADEQAHDVAMQRLERFVEETLADVDADPPRLVAIPSDQTADALVDASRDAELLVIGTRGRGGFAGLLLGSVAHRCIQQAPCPLLILPPGD